MPTFIVIIERTVTYRARVEADNPIVARAEVSQRIQNEDYEGITVGTPKLCEVLIRRLGDPHGDLH